MDFGIRGRKAICAGASMGMGFQAALALAREGVDLVISARGEAKLKEAAEAIAGETGVSVTPVAADHSTAEGRAKLLAARPDADILVITCSPPRMTESYLDITEAEWGQCLPALLASHQDDLRFYNTTAAANDLGTAITAIQAQGE